MLHTFVCVRVGVKLYGSENERKLVFFFEETARVEYAYEQAGMLARASANVE